MTDMNTPVIVAYKRTPLGRMLGGLSRVKATGLGSIALKAVLEEVPAIVEHIDEAIFGCVLQAGLGQNPARQVGLGAGLPDTLAAYTVNKVCGSSLKAAMLAAQAIKAGDGDVFVVGGIENMSLAPHLASVRGGVKFGPSTMIDHMQHDGLHCPFCDWGMGNGAEWVADEYEISREEQDRFSVQSHQRAAKAAADGLLAGEIVAVDAKTARQKQDITFDEGVRADTSVEALGKLRPAFRKDGSVTAGNASQITDGGGAMAVMRLGKAEELGITPLAKIVSYHTHGVEPKKIFTAPIGAVRAVVEKAGVGLEDVDLFELNEAFAAQSLCNVKSLELSEEKVNIWGGAIALGHPLGVSGVRVLGTLVRQLQHTGGQRGVAAACLGGGNAVAMLVERM